jgi:serine/threonine protein kinase
VSVDDPARAATTASGGDDDKPEASRDTLPAGEHVPTSARPASRLAPVDRDRYAVSGEMARGGLGRILRARDRHLGRQVALKEMLRGGAEAERRFVREALITARLEHPSIVPVHDAGRGEDGAPFYAMKLVGGRALSDVYATATTTSERLALVPRILAVADAIAYAHSQRVIHRDLKPANVLCGEFGETVVIDWGLAKDLDGGADEDVSVADTEAVGMPRLSASHTIGGAILGTPAYMAPEQAAGAEVDERADVYALGAMLYELLSGAPPHRGDTLDDVLRRVISGDLEPLHARAPDVPADLAAIVAKAMGREPGARYRRWRRWSATGGCGCPSSARPRAPGSHRRTRATSRWSRSRRPSTTGGS